LTKLKNFRLRNFVCIHVDATKPRRYKVYLNNRNHKYARKGIGQFSVLYRSPVANADPLSALMYSVLKWPQHSSQVDYCP